MDDRPNLSKAPAPGDSSPAREYKRVVEGIADAAERLRATDRAKAAALAVELSELQQRMYAAADRAALTEVGVELSWEAALEALWVESWMTLRRRPAPAPGGGPDDLDTLDVEVERCTAELLAAVKRRFTLGFG